MKRALIAASLTLALPAGAVFAEELSCVSTAFRLIGKNDRVCINAFDDPKVSGVTSYIGQARTGGVSGTLGLAEDPSRFSITCTQIGPISADLAQLPDKEKVYSDSTSLFFKHTHIYRSVDKKRNTLVYVAISDKLIDGSPQNAISMVPIMPWTAR